ncbi:hypothetical protein BASA81_004091 [Batrachochytrium salamandrivorans]|nr:hypothetical protein BASA81_004091 [Batrachochytrium salamandrivorans]
MSTRTLSAQVLRAVKHRAAQTGPMSEDQLIQDVVKDHGPLSPSDGALLSKRVRDILHVLVACGMLRRDKAQLVPFPNHPLLPATTPTTAIASADELGHKKILLANLLQQHILLHELAKRNQDDKSSLIAADRLALPFLLVQSTSNHPCELDVSENKCKVTATFSGDSFDVTDDISVLLGLGLLDQVSEHTIRDLIPEPLLGLLPPVLQTKLASGDSSSSAKKQRLESTS